MMNRIHLLALASLLGGLLAGCSSGTTESAKTDSTPATTEAPKEQETTPVQAETFDIQTKIGEAVAYSVRDLDGKVQDQDALKGSVVLLDFWASWCVTCKAASPTIDRIHRSYAEKGLKTFAVNTFESVDGGEDKVKAIAASGEATKKYQGEHDYAFSFAVYGDEVATQWQLGGVPAFVLFDKEGKVAMVQTNAKEENLKLIEEKIKELTAQ